MKGKIQGEQEEKTHENNESVALSKMVTPRFSLRDIFESFAYLLHMSFCYRLDELIVKFLF